MSGFRAILHDTVKFTPVARGIRWMRVSVLARGHPSQQRGYYQQKSLQMALRQGDHAGDAQAEGGGRGRRNTQWATAAAVKSVYRVDLKRADADLCLLGGDDEGGQGTATR